MAPNIPKTCKAVVLTKPGDPWPIKEVPVELPQAGEILIKVKACGVCHSDVALQAGHFGPMAKFPVIPGHEVVGDVVAVGPNEKKWKVGDRVGGPWHGGHDGTCKACNRGLFQMCDHEEINGVTRNGGYAEYTTLRTEATVGVPSDLDIAETAPLLCAGITVFNSIRKLNIPQGDTVVIQGLGGLGHLALQYSRKMGYKTIAVSTSDAKKDFATRLGANEYIDTSKQDAAEAIQKLGGAAAVVVTAPNPQVIGPMLNALHAAGKLLVLAPVGPVEVNTATMIGKGLSVHGWPSGHALDSEEAIDFARNQGVKCMVEKFPLSKVQDAVDHMLSGKARFRAVLMMEE